MLKNCLTFVALAIIMAGCKKDAEVLEPQSVEPKMSVADSKMGLTLSDDLNEASFESDARNPRICVYQFSVNDPIILDEEDDPLSPKGVYDKGTKWANGKTLKVFFINGSDFLRGKVMTYARKWAQHANIHFAVTENKANSDIRVGFKLNGDDGSWSKIGTDAKNYIGRQTMNFGWFNRQTDEREFSRVIVHEFGHAIGLGHEHLSPVANINWNKPVVYKYYIEEEGWTRQQVNQNIFNKYKERDVRNTRYDPKSIMHYYVPAEHTTDGVEVGYNLYLSEKDKAFIGRIYRN